MFAKVTAIIAAEYYKQHNVCGSASIISLKKMEERCSYGEIQISPSCLAVQSYARHDGHFKAISQRPSVNRIAKITVPNSDETFESKARNSNAL